MSNGQELEALLRTIRDVAQKIGINILWAIFALVVWRKIIKLVVMWLRKWLNKIHLDVSIRKFTISTVRILLQVLLLITVANTVGLETTSLVALVGAAWLAVGLALQGSLQNVAGGVLILTLKPFLVGEYIDVNGTAGTVDAITMFTTTLITPDKKMITIPNSTLANGQVINFSRQPVRRLDLVIGVSYNADITTVKKVLTDVVTAHPHVLPEPEPTIRLHTLADSSVDRVVRPFVNKENYWPTYYDLMEQIKAALDEHKIEIPFPQRVVHLQK